MLNVKNTSYWEQKSFFDKIDFLIIGAGIVGYSTALHLREKYSNAKIVILERGVLPSGASSKNAGFACFGSATELFDDLKNIPENEVWETVALRWKGLGYLRQLIGDENLSLKINGSWDLIREKDLELYNATVKNIDYYNQKLEEITGEKDVYSVDEKVNARFGLNSIETSFYNRLEGQIDTSKMNSTFFKLVTEKDIQVLFGVEVHEINQIEKVALTSFGQILADNIVICTNGFAKDLIEKEDVSPARAQVLITKPIKNLQLEGTFHYNQGYYYFRNIDNRVLLGGGRNLDIEGETTTKMKNTLLIMDELKKLLREVILPNTEFEIEHEWTGIMGVGKSKKPIIKKINPGIYCGIRLGGMGVAIGSLVGKELADLIETSN